MNSALFYFLIALCTASLAELSARLKDRTQSAVVGLISMVIPAFFAGIRFGIGTDYYYTYEPYYKYLTGEGDILAGGQKNLEIGYHLLNVFFAKIGADFHVLLFVVSLLTFFFFRKAIWVYKKEISMGLATFVFMLLYYQQTFNLVRQMLAAVIILYAFHYIDEKKPIHYIAWVIFAMLFHVTAIVALPFYWLGNALVKKKYRVATVIFYVLFTLAVFNFDKFAVVVNLFDPSGYYATYLQKVSEFELSVGVLIRTVPYVIVALLMWRTIKKNRTVSIYMHSFLLGSILRLIVYMARFSADRIAIYFLVPQAIFVPYLVKTWNHRWRNLIGALILIGATILLWYFDYIYMGRGQTVPYQSIFTRNIVYYF